MANDDFMKQLGHTSRLIPLLHEESSQVSKVCAVCIKLHIIISVCSINLTILNLIQRMHCDVQNVNMVIIHLSKKSDLSELLNKQLSHSEGIRGFFAVYLTSPESLETGDVPSVLVQAVRGANAEIMVPLACKL